MGGRQKLSLLPSKSEMTRVINEEIKIEEENESENVSGSNTRKNNYKHIIYVATNIIEESVTLPRLVIVADTG